MHGSEDPAVLEDALVQRPESDQVGMEQRPAAMTRKTVAGGPHHVDVAGAQRNALLQDPDAFVDQRIQAPFQNFLIRVLPRGDAQPLRGRAQDRYRLRVLVPGPVTRLIAVIALAVLLPETSGRVQREVGLIVGRIGRITTGVRAVHVHADVDARHVEDAENAHRHAPALEHGVDAPRRRAFEHHALGLAGVPFHHPVADESVADAREHGRLAQRPRQFHRRRDRRGRGPRRAHDFEQRHHVRRREEVQPDHVFRPRDRGRDLLDIEGRGVCREHGARLRRRIEPREDVLLEVHPLEDRLDDHIGVGEIGVIERPADQRQAPALFFRRDATAPHHRVERALDDLKTAVERLAVHVEDRDRQAGVGEADRDTPAHRARSDDRAGPHRPRRRALRQVRQLARRALREKYVDERA